ncbi:hypothetical protein DPMN_087204 [Dreissena polymorpha]|uniref:Uncharacterized protein n=1 Tax=Dreissena polymorpha TaxID=45954 RepID=A0A9D4KSJ7_DREPO|nr:hypothetical protein DPMN_087204 [Dreissena polymorpha]
MRYFDETKELFWTGKRSLGGQFIRFMRGFAHQGCVSEGKCQKGVFDPSESQINCVVPCDSVLAEFTQPYVVDVLQDQIHPGILKSNIEMSSKAMPDTSHIVMIDGKKIIPNSADLYLLDKEEAKNITNRRPL